VWNNRAGFSTAWKRFHDFSTLWKKVFHGVENGAGVALAVALGLALRVPLMHSR
jgi:hypothetical protein